MPQGCALCVLWQRPRLSHGPLPMRVKQFAPVFAAQKAYNYIFDPDHQLAVMSRRHSDIAVCTFNCDGIGCCSKYCFHLECWFIGKRLETTDVDTPTESAEPGTSPSPTTYIVSTDILLATSSQAPAVAPASAVTSPHSLSTRSPQVIDIQTASSPTLITSSGLGCCSAQRINHQSDVRVFQRRLPLSSRAYTTGQSTVSASAPSGLVGVVSTGQVPTMFGSGMSE